MEDQLRISFDLDDTLIISGDKYKYENSIGFPFSLFYKEKLRFGTIKLCQELKILGYSICVYTTSERPIRYIRKLLKLYGIHLEKIINLPLHLKLVQGNRSEIMPSKVPSKFAID